MKCHSGILICLSDSLWCSIFQAIPIPSPNSTLPHPQATCKAKNNSPAKHHVISNYIFQPLAQLVICLKMHRISSKQECDSNCHYMLTRELWHAPSLRRQVGLRLDQCQNNFLNTEVAPEIKAGWCEGWSSPLGTTWSGRGCTIGGKLNIKWRSQPMVSAKFLLLFFYSKFEICSYLFDPAFQSFLESIFVLSMQLHYIPTQTLSQCLDRKSGHTSSS